MFDAVTRSAVFANTEISMLCAPIFFTYKTFLELRVVISPLQKEASMSWCQGSTRNGRRDPKCLSARRLCMVREDTRASSEGATCVWMAADEAVGCTRAFLTMWRSSRRLVCQGRSEPGLRVNDISRIHWSQQLLTTQSEQPD
ncbi:uncharacterized protein TNCV_107151 [Trichonephila clavipes]|nr:uncharacterized protein TNCV_107151 [Trichonephila clavipes]